MDKTFAKLLRKTRVQGQKNLREVAEALGVSVAYVSDVERGTKAALLPRRVLEFAHLLNIDPMPLLKAANFCRGTATIDVPPTASQAQLTTLAALHRGLSDDEWELLANALSNKERE